MSEMNYMRKCARCEEEKNVEEFGITRGKPRSYCKRCCVEVERIRRSKDILKFRETEKLNRLNKISLYKERERRASDKRSLNPEYRKDRREKARRKKESEHRANGFVTVCAGCGIKFCWLFGKQSWMKRCLPCAAEYETQYRQDKARRQRALKRGATVEMVHAGKVFDRDGWRCQLCGCKTPKAKRGTYDNDAPELDHIMPLSKGGEHSYLNTQCACRKCNIAKSSKPMGQMLLIS